MRIARPPTSWILRHSCGISKFREIKSIVVFQLLWNSVPGPTTWYSNSRTLIWSERMYRRATAGRAWRNSRTCVESGCNLGSSSRLSGQISKRFREKNISSAWSRTFLLTRNRALGITQQQHAMDVYAACSGGQQHVSSVLVHCKQQLINSKLVLWIHVIESRETRSV